MQPLPDLADLPPADQIYDPVQDDLVSLLAQDTADYNSFLDSLGSQQNDLTSSASSISGSIDGLDSGANEAIAALDTLSTLLDAVDYNAIITNYLGNESLLDQGIDDHSFSLVDAAAAFLKALWDLATFIFNVMFNVLKAVVLAIEAAVAQLTQWISWLLAAAGL